MTQPSFVPIAEVDQVRPSLQLEAPRQWQANRPAEQRWPVHPGGTLHGQPGPDQGYALHLARRFEDRLHLEAGESDEDVLVGCALLAARRAALFGRAPSAPDLRTAFAVWGFLDEAPPEALVAARRRVFPSVAHEYALQRALADSVPDEVLRLKAEEVAAQMAAGTWPTAGVTERP